LIHDHHADYIEYVNEDSEIEELHQEEYELLNNYDQDYSGARAILH